MNSAEFLADAVAGYDDYIRGRVSGDGGGGGSDRTSVTRIEELVKGVRAPSDGGAALTRRRGAGYRVGIELAQLHRRLAEAGAGNESGELLVSPAAFGYLVLAGEVPSGVDLAVDTMATGISNATGGLADPNAEGSYLESFSNWVKS